MNLAFFDSAISGDTGTKCADVVISPTDGDIPLNVSLSTPQTGGHIFYVVGNASQMPQHVGDNATSPTVRIGSNNGSVFIGSAGPAGKYIAAVCYQSGFLDSNITHGGPYTPPPGPL
jgi:hypothetical protein